MADSCSGPTPLAQIVERPANRSYYVNLPVVLAEAMGVQKGDELEWFLEEKNTLVLTRVSKEKARRLRSLAEVDAYGRSGMLPNLRLQRAFMAGP